MSMCCPKLCFFIFRMVRRKLVDNVEEVEFGSILLKHLFGYTVEDSICFLVNAGALKNEMECDNCRSQMNIMLNMGKIYE